MANFNDIKHEIDQNVNTNGVQAITGAILNETLKDMIDEVDEKKQDTLVAGQNITIQGNVISATGGGSGTTYEAGHGIDINHEYPNDVISVDASDLAGAGLAVSDGGELHVDWDSVQEKLVDGENIRTVNGEPLLGSGDIDIPEYTAGDGINISAIGDNYVISVDPSDLAGSGLEVDEFGALKTDPSLVQSKLTAGDGLEIDQNNEISVKAGTGLGFDANGYLINTGGGGGGTTYTAGDGIEIDQNDAINAKLGNGLQLDQNNSIEIDTSVVASQSDLSAYLRNDASGRIQNFLDGTGDTELKIVDGYDEDYVKLGAYDTPGEAPHIEIYENGSGDTKFFYDHLERGSQISIDYPTDSGTIALTSDIPTPGAGLQVSVGNEIYVDTTQIQEKLTAGANIQINGSTISATDTNTTYSAGSGLNLNGTTFSVDTSAIQEKLTSGTNIKTINGTSLLGSGDIQISGGSTYTAGNGINIDQNNEISVDSSDLAGSGLMVDQNGALAVIGGGGSGLWTSGTGTNSLMAPAAAAGTATASGTGAISMGNASQASGNYSIASGTATASGDHAVALGAGTANGYYSVMLGTMTTQGVGDQSVALNAKAANAHYSIAGPQADASGANTTIGNVAFGYDATASPQSYTTAIGHGARAQYEGTTAIGNFNEYYGQNSGSASLFAIGNGTSDNARSNALEIRKSDNAVYIDGIGAYSGDSRIPGVKSLQAVLAGKQDLLTAGSGISIQNNVISATGGGSGTSFTPGDALELDANDNLNVLYGSGLTLSANNELEVDPSSISGFLPLVGGTLQEEQGSASTTLSIQSPNGYSSIDFTADDDYDGNGTSKSEIAIGDSNGSIQIGTVGISDGTYTTSWPSPSADTTFATLEDVSGFLPLTGGTLQEDPIQASETELYLLSPNGYQGSIYLHVNDSDPGNTTESSPGIDFEGTDSNDGTHNLTVDSSGIGANTNVSGNSFYLGTWLINDLDPTLGGQSQLELTEDDAGTITTAIYDSTGITNADGYKISFPAVSADDTFALLSDIQGGGSYTAGSGIDITNDVISVDTSTIQSKLTAGANIQINGNTISATDTNTTYSAGSGLNLNGTTFSADTTVLQEKLTAGSGISISGNTISATGGGGQSYSAGHGIDITNNTISVDASDLAGDFLPIQGGVLQNDSGTDTSLDIASPGDGDVSISMQVFQDEANSQFQIDNNTVHEVVPGEGESISDFTINNNGETGFALGVASFYVDDNGDWVRDVFESGEFFYSPAGQAMPAEIHLDTSSSNLSDPGNEDSEAKITIQDNRGYVEFNPTGFSDGTYTLSFPSLSQDETIATLSDIQGGGSYTAGSGIDITNDVISVDTTTIQEKLTAGQNITISGNVISASGGGGASYSAGSGIDITNNTISVDNTIATVSDLGGYLPLTGGTLQEDPNDSTSTELLIQSPETYATADLTTVDLDPGNTPESLAKLTLSDYDSSSNPHTAIYGTDGISNGTYKISFPTLTQDDTFALLSDVQGGGGASYSAGTGINIDANNVISNTAPGLWTSGAGTNSLISPSSLTYGNANGNYSVAAGTDSKATGASSFVIGGQCQGIGNNSFAGGSSSSAAGSISFAFGQSCNARNASCVALGSYCGTHSSATYAIAIGNNSQANASNSYSIGTGSATSNVGEMSLGYFPKTTGSGTDADKTHFIVGNGTGDNAKSNVLEIKKNNDAYLVGIGGFTGTNSSSASTLQTVINGKQDVLTAGSGISISGNVISATGGGGGGSCLWSSSTGTNSLISPGAAAGVSSDAAGTGAITVGYDSTADGDYAFAQGAASVASGLYSFAANNGTASGDYSAAFSAAGAYGDNSFAAGGGAIAGAAFSVSLGDGNVVFDDSDPNNVIDAQYGVAIGSGSVVEGEYGTAIGGGVASGEGSVAIGSGSTADGLYDVAVAGGNSRGNYSFAASSGQTDSQGHYASALSGGYATGESSLASGQDTNAFGYSSIALGLGVNTYDQVDGSDRLDTNAGEVALGRYNFSESGIIFSIGCGYYDSEGDQEVRENSVAIDTDGKIYLKGLGGYTGQGVAGCTDLVSFLNNL